MSFMGCIGHIMEAGLEDAFLLNYGPNTVQHMMSGKAFDRALRGHLLLVELVVGDVSSPAGGQLTSSDVVQDLRAMCTAVLQDEVDADQSHLLSSKTVVKVAFDIDELKCKLSAQSRTARLWIQYLWFTQLLKSFITAKRTGNWHLHLSTRADVECLRSCRSPELCEVSQTLCADDEPVTYVSSLALRSFFCVFVPSLFAAHSDDITRHQQVTASRVATVLYA